MSLFSSIKSLMTGDEKKDSIAAEMLLSSYSASLGKVEATHDISKLTEVIMNTIIADGMIKKPVVKLMIKSVEEDPVRMDKVMYWIHLTLSEYYKDVDKHQGCMCEVCRNERSEKQQQSLCQTESTSDNDTSELVTDTETSVEESTETNEHKKEFGLIVIDRREASIGLLKDGKIIALAHLTSMVPGKNSNAYKMFLQRRLIAINEFYTRVGELIDARFEDINDIFIGGPSPTKEEFEGGQYFKKNVLGLFDVANTDESGLYELYDRIIEHTTKAVIEEDAEINSGNG
jgi:hypothetical protein